MRILLCTATEMEIAPTIQALSLSPNSNITILITGVGLLAATFSLTKAVITNRPDVIIQAGVAGTLSTERSLADVVAVKNEVVGDLGVLADGRFQSLFDLRLLSDHALPWKDRKLPNNSTLLSTCALPLVDAVTVNEISTNQERIDYYHHTLHAEIESMEGAALHFVGLSEDIPFLQLRSLSNFIGERDKSKWQMKEAITKLNIELQRLLTKLKEQ